jgi:hypothetical protein
MNRRERPWQRHREERLAGSAGFAGCYAQLAELCRHVLDLDPGSAAALMDAFNLVADLGTPTRLPTTPRVGLTGGLARARSQLHELQPAAASLPQLLALTRADALLAAVQDAHHDTHGTDTTDATDATDAIDPTNGTNGTGPADGADCAGGAGGVEGGRCGGVRR